jgi:hypothetical protein
LALAHLREFGADVHTTLYPAALSEAAA